MDVLTNVPVWVWVVVALIVFAFITGQRKLWDLEVKFPLEPEYGRGEIELECGSKSGSRVEGEFDLTAACAGKTLDVILNDRILHSVSIPGNLQGQFRFDAAVVYDQPAEGDTVAINIGGAQAFIGRLVRD